MNANEKISRACFYSALGSVALSILTWTLAGDGEAAAHTERLALFVGLWAPTFMGAANYFRVN